LSTPEYNQIYERLVDGPDDAVGAFAYVLYKQHKVEYVKNIKATLSRKPTDAEMEQFHQQNSLNTQINGYKDRAEVLVQAFLNAGLEKRIGDIETDVRKSELGVRIENVQRTLNEKKTIMSWFSEGCRTFAVNILTILVVGALVIGYKYISSINMSVEKNIGLADTAQEPKYQAYKIAPAPQIGNAKAPVTTYVKP
jgi:hypothetical protein